ncbi:Na+-driven multidrug efflux pump [Candidatus Phytoplasma australiense]|uniref:Na+-driven multidrug efflux pump n=2 Tax=Phytoplasma australiense TaxID=59748 RepID=B1V968_PHYAS|nr:MATE family efflux transporter [Candidatus Phytoplasma australiense]AGL90828.1 Na+-Driven Multidrug Efflux Pump [Strawberry lethal yellows phytoplasma (CPA) str. NZSb11]CAM11500.1 Na+-driven multidrug efflux pump [Candidatus Phytoplasma australiense]
MSVERQTSTKDSNQKTFKRAIYKNLIILSLPIAIYLLFQHLTTSIDFAIIGDSQKTTNVDSTITYMKQIKKILQSIAIALGGAGVVLVAREYKKQNKEKSRQYATLAFLLAVTISLAFLAFLGLGVFLPKPLGDLFLKSDYHADGGLLYYQLSLITFVFITINSVFIALERAKNKTKFILILNIFLITLRVVLSFIYKFVKEKGQVTVIDLALADLLSNLFITCIAFFCMFNPKNPFQLQFKKITFPKDVVKGMLKLIGTLIIGKVTYEIGKKIILDMTTNYYKDIVAISGLVAVVNGICYSISQSFEDSQSAMVSQSVAFESNQKTFKIFKNVFVITFIIGLFGFLINEYFGVEILSFVKQKNYTPQTHKEMLENFKIILRYEGTSLFTSVWASMMMGYILSYKKNANLIFWMNLLRVVLRISILFVLHNIFSSTSSTITPAHQFGLSTLGSNATVLIVTTVIFISFLSKNKAKNRQQQK